jgi:hypothetical protein
MARPRPRDPEALAATIAVLRAFSEEAPRNDLETEAASSLRASGADREAARRLIGNFDRINPAVRRRALGEFADRPLQVVPELQSRRVEEALRVGRERLRGTRVVEGGTPTASSGSRVLDDARADIDERMSTGEEATAEETTYGIKYIGMVCEKETTWDGFSNSDEVYFITSAVTVDSQLNNTVRTEKHPVDSHHYQDVDAHEVREGPEAQCWGGSLFPVSLTTVAFEHDYGDPDKYRDEVDALVKAAIIAAGLIFGLGAGTTALLEALSGTITDAVNWVLGTADDEIGIPQTYVFTQAEFEAAGASNQFYYNYQDGAQLRQTNLIGHLFSSHSGSGARYTLGFRFERAPDPFRYEGPIL